MPYLGGANLAQVLEAAGSRATGPRTQAQGRSLVDALDLDRPSRRSASRPVRWRRRIGSARRQLDPLARSSRDGDRAGSTPASDAVARRDPAPIAPEAHPLLAPDPVVGGLVRGGGRRPRLIPRRTTLAAGAAVPLRRRATSGPRSGSWRGWPKGLDHAHSRGLLHRDLKPPNILVAADGTPMLLDFNLATLALGRVRPTTRGTKAKMGGTLPYMAPEHLDAFNPREARPPPEAVDERSDIYALGLILFEMIAGRPAFPDPPPGMNLLRTCSRLPDGRAATVRPLAPRREPGSALGPRRDRRQVPGPRPRPSDYRSARELRRGSPPVPRRPAAQVHTIDPSVRETRVIKWSRRHPRASRRPGRSGRSRRRSLLVDRHDRVGAGHATSARSPRGSTCRRFHEAFQRDASSS